jgi:hypothetical protein
MKRVLKPLKEKVSSQFPYKTITTLGQCLEAFEFIANEIEKIATDIDDGIDLIFNARVFREAVNFTKYDTASEKIRRGAEKVAAISALINNFLVNKTIPGHENDDRTISVEACVGIVDTHTDGTEGLVNGYNKNKKIDMPSIETWYNNYVQSIKSFNTAIDAWNVKFQTNENKARLPNIQFKFSEAFKGKVKEKQLTPIKMD